MDILPVDLINKILIMRPVHPCAKIMKQIVCDCDWRPEFDECHLYYSITQGNCSEIKSKYEFRNGDDDIYYRKNGDIDWIAVGI
jgi:hypothetical protein